MYLLGTTYQQRTAIGHTLEEEERRMHEQPQKTVQFDSGVSQHNQAGNIRSISRHREIESQNSE